MQTSVPGPDSEFSISVFFGIFRKSWSPSLDFWICLKLNLFMEGSGLIRRRQWHPTPVLLPGKSHGRRSLVGCNPWGRLQSMGSLRVRNNFTFTFHFHALEKEMATHSSVLAWRIPGMGEPGGLPSMGSYRVRHNWSDLAATAAYIHGFPW